MRESSGVDVGMKDKRAGLSWSEVLLFAGGAVPGALLGVLATVFLVWQMAQQAPGFWFVSRAAAIVGYLLLWASSAWGIMLSAKGSARLTSGPLAYGLHNLTSWLALGFAAVHSLSLLGDRIVPFTLREILVPYAANYEPILTGLGTLSLYLGVLVTAAFFWRRTLGNTVWRAVHAMSYLMFVMVTLHGALLGTDSGALIMQVIYVLAGGSVLFLTLYRVFTAGRLGTAVRSVS